MMVNGDDSGADVLAQQVLDVAFLAMRELRLQLRHTVEGGVSLAQFPVLAFLHRHPGSSLTPLATHMGLTPPSVSRLVDALVERALVHREVQSGDRRRISLSLTAAGQQVMTANHDGAREQLAHRLASMDAGERTRVGAALDQLTQRLRTAEGEC